jgi:hypothetical protein
VVVRQHGQGQRTAQAGLMHDHRPGPLPDVLARLAEGIDAPPAQHERSVVARSLGFALCAVIAALVLVAVFTVGYP